MTMNNIFKKTLALLACASLIGQTLITGVVSASEKITAIQSASEVSKSVSVSSRVDSTAVSKEVNKSISDVKPITNHDVKIVAGSNNESKDKIIKICDKGTTRTALNIMKDAVNEEISSKNITGIMATVEGGKLVLILNKDKKIWDLTPYKDSLTNLLLGYDEVSIRSKLKQKGFLLDISTVSQLIDINLGLDNKKLFDLNVWFIDCSVEFQLEFRTNNNSTQICNDNTTRTALNIMKEAINEEISSKNITGVRANIDGNNLVLMVNKNKEIWDLTPYVNSLINVILWYDDDTIWYRLHQQWFKFDVSNVTQLINIKLGIANTKLYDMSVRFNDCLLKFQLEFRTDNNSTQICDTNTSSSALNIIKNAVNEEIVSKNATGIRTRIEWNKLVLLLSNGKDIPDLTPYVDPLYDVMLGHDTVSIWSKLANQGFVFNSSNVTQLYNMASYRLEGSVTFVNVFDSGWNRASPLSVPTQIRPSLSWYMQRTLFPGRLFSSSFHCW